MHQHILMNQGQLFDEPVAENYDEAEAFLEDCFAVVADNLDDVRAYMEEEGHGRGRNVGCQN